MKKSIFEAVANHLWDHRYYYNELHQFDYPWYAGISQKYSRYLSLAAVDAIQEIWPNIIEKDFYVNKKDFLDDLSFEIKYQGEDIT